jgi:hypothetical protein
MTIARVIDPFLKADPPARTPEASQVKSPLACAKDLTL